MDSGTAGYPDARAGLVSNGFFVLYAENIGVPPLLGGARPLSVGGGVTYDWRLTAGGTMRSPDELQALSRPFQLVMQGDGNLVMRTEVRRDGYLYELLGYRPYWQSGTSGHPGAYAVMQRDGNLVVYSPGGQPLWNSGTRAIRAHDSTCRATATSSSTRHRSGALADRHRRRRRSGLGQVAAAPRRGSNTSWALFDIGQRVQQR